MVQMDVTLSSFSKIRLKRWKVAFSYTSMNFSYQIAGLLMFITFGIADETTLRHFDTAAVTIFASISDFFSGLHITSFAKFWEIFLSAPKTTYILRFYDFNILLTVNEFFLALGVSSFQNYLSYFSYFSFNVYWSKINLSTSTLRNSLKCFLFIYFCSIIYLSIL